MNKEQQLTWEQIPKEIYDVVFTIKPHSLMLDIANNIMQAIKPIVENARLEGWNGGVNYGQDKSYYGWKTKILGEPEE